MESLVKKYFWIVNLLVLGIVAYLFADTINGEIASRYLKVTAGVNLNEPVAEGGTDEGSPLNRIGSSTYADDLKNRSPFNSDPKEPEEPVEESEPKDESEKKERKEGELEESDLDIKLVGTLVAEPATLSVATVNAQGASRIVRIGAELDEGAKLLHIARRYIIVDESGTQKVIRLWARGRRRRAPLPENLPRDEAGNQSPLRPNLLRSPRGNTQMGLPRFPTPNTR